MEIILWDFFMLYQSFLSPQAKGSAIFSNKQDVYELPHQFPPVTSQFQSKIRATNSEKKFKICLNG